MQDQSAMKLLLYMCPRSTVHYIRVLIPLHTTIYVSSYCHAAARGYEKGGSSGNEADADGDGLRGQSSLFFAA